MTHPTAAILIIGNEILSGRTQDLNLKYLATRLAQLGITLEEAVVIPDQERAIISTVQRLCKVYTYVFTTGGIGGTHDDITAACLAKAFGVSLVMNPEALKRLEDYYGERLNDARRRMALIPEGASLIDNPVSKAPGFCLHNVYALAGVPLIMQAMFESLASTLVSGEPIQYVTVTCSLPEGTVADALGDIQKQYPEVDIGSYPYFKAGTYGVSFVVRGRDVDFLMKAKDDIVKMVYQFGDTPILESH